MVMFFLFHALFVARSDMNNLCIAFQYLNLSGGGGALLKCKSEKNFVAGSRSAGPYLIFVTPGVDVLFPSRCPFLHREREMLAYVGQFWLFCFECTHLLVYFCRAKLCGGAPKLTNIRYAAAKMISLALATSGYWHLILAAMPHYR